MAQTVTHILYMSEVEGLSPLSGAENHLRMLLPALAKTINVELIVMLWEGSDFTKVRNWLESLEEEGVKTYTIVRGTHLHSVGNLSSKIFVWFKLWKMLIRRRKNIVHLHLETKYTPLIVKFACCHNIIFSIHNDEPLYIEKSWRKQAFILNKVVKHFIAITDNVHTYFKKAANLSDSKISTIYYGIRENINSPLSRQEVSIPEGEFVVGFVGRLTQQKNLSVFLTALSQRPHLLGVIVGNGPMREDLMLQARENNISNVMFLGDIPLAERVMPTFDVLCLPSLWEGLGLVLLEAMLRRVPVMGSKKGAIPDILGEGKYGLLFEPTVNGLLHSFDEVYSRRGTLMLDADRAYHYAKERFTVDRMSAETLLLYESVLKEN